MLKVAGLCVGHLDIFGFQTLGLKSFQTLDLWFASIFPTLLVLFFLTFSDNVLRCPKKAYSFHENFKEKRL